MFDESIRDYILDKYREGAGDRDRRTAWMREVNGAQLDGRRPGRILEFFRASYYAGERGGDSEASLLSSHPWKSPERRAGY